MAKSLLHFYRTCVVAYSRNLQIQPRMREVVSFVTSGTNLYFIKQLAKGLFLTVILINFITCAFNSNSLVENLNTNIFLYAGSKPQNTSEIDLRSKVLKIVSSIKSRENYPELKIVNPYNETIFPLDVASPTFIWEDKYLHSKIWLIVIGFENNNNKIYVLTDRNTWTPNRKIWEIIKANSSEERAFITIAGVNHKKSFKVITRSRIIISTSKDKVGSPIFYRQVPPSFAYANKHPQLTKWRLGDIASYDEPRIILENLPICGNCHSFSRDGRVFGMDIDYKGDKGAYVFAQLKNSHYLSEDDFISWNDFPGPGNTKHMGLFSRISPDGRYAVSTISEKNFMALLNELDFSQLFLTASGLIACHDREQAKFFLLPGADDPNYVQTHPEWSPEGKYIVFSRAKVNARLLEVIKNKAAKITPDTRIEDLNEQFYIQYDLYCVSFNQGKGSRPHPLTGASNNGKSNYAARYSPDGKWIVFNQSKTGLLLQPDSELYIMPAEGGIARKLRCNTNLMNSWHSWSPNGRWLVFASKVNTPFTELFLTHIDESGIDSPPVLLTRLSSKEYAANIPEFISIEPEAFPQIELVE